jgi:hypothetical protein
MIICNKYIPVTNKYTKICDTQFCVNSKHWLHRDDDAYDIAKHYLLKNCIKENDCLLYNGSKNLGGYGSTAFKGKHTSTHILAMMIHIKSEIPKNKIVRHKCKNKHCCSIDHLELGTQKDNADDKNRDGTMLKGEAHPLTNLTNNMVIDIFNYKQTHTDSFSKMAKMFSTKYNIIIKSETIHRICNGYDFNHITLLPKRKRIRERTKIDKEFIDKHHIAIQQKIRNNIKIEQDNKTIEFIGNNSPHWIWTLGTNKGYGMITYLNAHISAHGMSYMAFNKSIIEKGMVVRHMCGNALCVSPNHLKIGTTTENNADQKLHGTVPLGENHANSKLSADMIKIIYVSQILELNSSERARLFDVNYSFIHHIDYKKTWKDTLDTMNVNKTVTNLFEYIKNKQQFINKIKLMDFDKIHINFIKLKIKHCASIYEHQLNNINRMDYIINNKSNDFLFV